MTQFEQWLEKVDKIRKEYWDKNFTYKEYTPLTYFKGRNYVRNTSTVTDIQIKLRTRHNKSTFT